MATPSNSSQGSHTKVGRRTSATLWSSLLSTKEALPWSLAVFCYLGSFWEATSPSSAISFSFLFFLKLATTNRLIVGGGGEERRKKLGLKGVLGHQPFSPIRKELKQALLPIQDHLLSFFLEFVIYACDDETGGANT